ncbi:hypothetical protein SADUNF_Sadunf16G0062000 [Salix dunnii]|uniref:Uncharacterized protein n=1 Tax=Salix dunnii TaxID=1413687 RepID=A0A835J8C2_9ROSI|nr:hypothetical protein SADUNF_Sadunf16G0062000 [Salix dunnii]
MTIVKAEISINISTIQATFYIVLCDAFGEAIKMFKYCSPLIRTKLLIRDSYNEDNEVLFINFNKRYKDVVLKKLLEKIC